ncbi:MAG: glycerol-3-phosphate dehydrogenase [Saprospiraceae bacterium]
MLQSLGQVEQPVITMSSHIESLSKERFDVVIAGGGIYGACIAEKLSKAGYKCALLEATDFGAKTSANTLGILHGGLRYIPRLDFKRIKRSVESRRYFLQLAPQLATITPFNIALKTFSIRNPWLMRCALALNDLVSQNRNLGVPSSVHIPNSRVIPKNSLDKGSLLYDQTSVSAVARWHETVINHPERLVLEVVMAARKHGCHLANYCKVEKTLLDKGKFSGVSVKNRFTNKTATIATRWLIDATGHNLGNLNAPIPASLKNTQWARSINLVIDRLIHPSSAFGLPIQEHLNGDEGKGKTKERQFFILPKGKQTVIGTFYNHQSQSNNGLKLSSKDKQTIVANINTAQPKLKIQLDEVTHWQSGWLPLDSTSTKASFKLRDHSSVNLHLFQQDHLQQQEQTQIQARRGIIEVRGVKFTTAPAVADEVVSMLKSHYQLSTNRKNPLSFEIVDSAQRSRPKTELEKTLFNKYGHRWQQTTEYFSKREGYLRPVTGETLVGEVCYAIDHEYAQRLTDVLCRRTTLAHNQRVSLSTAIRIAKIMQAQLSWSETRYKVEMKQAHKADLILT